MADLTPDRPVRLGVVTTIEDLAYSVLELFGNVVGRVHVATLGDREQVTLSTNGHVMLAELGPRTVDVKADLVKLGPVSLVRDALDGLARSSLQVDLEQLMALPCANAFAVREVNCGECWGSGRTSRRCEYCDAHEHDCECECGGERYEVAPSGKDEESAIVGKCGYWQGYLGLAARHLGGEGLCDVWAHDGALALGRGMRMAVVMRLVRVSGDDHIPVIPIIEREKAGGK